MLLLPTALRAIAAAVETPSSLPSLIANVEAALSAAVYPARIEILLACGGASSKPGTEFPLRLDGNVIGIMRVHAGAATLARETEESLQLLAAPLAAAIGYRQRPERRGRDGETANVDSLCRIPNRRAFDEHLPEAWDRASTRGSSLVMALVDVDYFKPYNDRYGHIAGDGCLQQVASLLVKRRDGDDGFAARYGGEEFALVFAETSLELAVEEVQHVFDRLATLHIEHAGTTLGRVSLSAGLASANPTGQRTMTELVEEADRALYQAKRFGRNRICAGTFVSKAPVVAKLTGRGNTFASADAPSFGRDDDLARIMSALHHTRMLTIVGAPGVGKSRLLMLVAEQAANRLHRPVVFVESELLRADIDPAIALASACDLSIDPGGALDAVTDFLADRQAIVILDDVQHARTEIRALCSHLCERTSSVSIVAAADAPLRIAAERTIVVPPLDDEAALALLAFHGGGDAAAGRALIRHLGGNPASIEAAAEWIVRLGMTTVMDRLAALGGVYTDPAELTAIFSHAQEV